MATRESFLREVNLMRAKLTKVVSFIDELRADLDSLVRLTAPEPTTPELSALAKRALLEYRYKDLSHCCIISNCLWQDAQCPIERKNPTEECYQMWLKADSLHDVHKCQACYASDKTAHCPRIVVTSAAEQDYLVTLNLTGRVAAVVRPLSPIQQ